MKPNTFLRSLLAITGSAALAAPLVNAATITWDPTGGGTSDGAGAWLTAGDWWDGSTNVNWTSGDDAVFGNGGAGGAVTLTGLTTVNSLTFNSFTGTYTLGTAGAGNTITLNNGITMNAGAGAATIVSPITLGAAQSWINNDDSLLTIGTGAVTNAGYLLTIGGTGNTTVSSVIGGEGGLTKTGAGILTLSGVNTFTGQLTVANGTLSIASINNTSANGTLGNSDLNRPVVLGSVGNTGTLQYTGATASSTKAFTLASGGTGAFDVTVGANTLTLSNVIYGSGSLTKTGAGTLTLSNNANQFTGNTLITNGRVALGAQYALWKSAYDTTGSTGAIGLNATGQAAPVLGGLAGSVDLATAITSYGSITGLTLNPQSGSSVSYGGVIANGAANMTLTKTGHGIQTLTGTNTYNGATNIFAGTLALSGASGTAQNSAFTVRGGTLLLNNSTAWADRLNDTTALSLGSLTLTSSNGAGIQTETVGATTFAVGGKVTINNGTTPGDQTTLAMGAVTRSAGAAIDFVGTGGTLGGGVNSPNVTAASGLTNTNGILGWATVNGNQWAENNSGSIQAYTGLFYNPTSEASDATKNTQLTGSGTLATAKSFNSLNLVASSSGQSFNLNSGANLTLNTLGGILKSGADAYTISSGGGNITAGASLIAHVDGGALTISAPLNTAILGIAKGGTGDLILSGSRAGTLSGAVSIAGGQLEFQGSSTTISGEISGAGGITVNLNAGQLLSFSGTSNKTYSGPTIVRGGILRFGTGWNAQSVPSTGGQNISGSEGQGWTTNVELNGGNFVMFWDNELFLGTEPGQIQITGGISGVTMATSPRRVWTINNDANYEVVWGASGEGAATGYFNPSVFSVQESSVAGDYLNIPNKFDLNGATRTIQVNSTTHRAELTGVIRNSTGTAGLIKTGAGQLNLSAANAFNGSVTVNQGTLTITGNLANGGANSALGSSSAAASNLLLGNGTTLQYTGGAASTDRSFTIDGTLNGHGALLDASGSGAVNFTGIASPDYGTVDQTRTLTLTGTNTGNNILAANIADNGTGAVSVTKTGAGVWVLSGTTSSYTGPTTLTAGTLSVSTAANLGDAASNLVFNGGFLRVTGTGLNDFADLGRTNPMVFNAGQNVGLDIADAGNTFTIDQTINHTGGLSKAGAGTLVINSTHTYTGHTSVSGGTLRLDDGGVISDAPLYFSGGTFAVNRSTTATQGTTFPGLIGGNGSLANIGADSLVLNAPTYHTGTTSATVGNITLSHDLAIQNSALNTTGAGFVTLSSVTTPTFGGLEDSGTTRNLADVITTGYDGITNLTLNPQSGSTFTYDGVIANNTENLSLTKTGVGTQILQGANTYSGETKIIAGTLTLSGASGSIASSAINLTGGGLTLNNATNSGSRVADTADITVNASSALTFTHGAAASTNYTETIDTLTLAAGTLTYAGTQAAATGTSIVTFNNPLVQSGTGTANFTGTGLGTNSRNRILFTGQTVGDLGPWAVVNGTDFATYSATEGVQALASTTLAVGSNSSTTNFNSNGAGITFNASLNPSLKTLLINSGTARTIGLNGNIVSVGGISTSGQTHIISGTGAVQALTAGDALYINVGANALTFNSVIQNVGAGATATTLVKSGGGQLTLNNTSNSYSGGTVINGGTLVLGSTSDAHLGASSGGLTFNGTVQSSSPDNTTLNANRTVTINEGANVTISNAFIVNGILAGSGTLTVNTADAFRFNHASNTFTGMITSQTAGSTTYGLEFASIGDTAGAGLINLVGGSGTFRWISASGSTTTLANRQFAISSAGAGIISALGTTAASNLVINKDLLITGAAGARTLRLIGSNTGNNTFAGKITDGPGSVVSLTKEEAGTWTISGNNTHSGGTTLTLGTLRINNASALGTGTFTLTAGTFDNTSGSALTNTNNNAIAWNGNVTFTGTNDLDLGTGNVTMSATRTLTNGGTLTMGGNISGSTFGIIKGGGGTFVLSGLSSYSGATTVNQGVLSFNTIGNVGGGNSALGAPATVGNGTIGLGSAALAATLRYTGTGSTTDRVINLSGTAGSAPSLDMSGTGTLAFTSNFTATGAGAKILTLTGSTAGTGVIQGSIVNGSGTTSLTKNGTGNWVLTGTNNYTGATNINQGILSIGTVATPTGSINSSAVTINGGNFRYNSTTDYAGALTFTTGTISGTNWNGSLDNLTIGANRTISPGNSPGTSNTGGQTWATGGTYEWEINNVTATAGADPGWDLLNGSGTLDITAVDGGEFTIEVLSLTLANAAGAATGFNDATSYNWMIANFNAITGFSADAFTIDTTQFALHNTFTGTFGVALGDSPGIGGDNTEIWLTYTAIPEPSVALLGGLGLLTLFRRRRA